MNPDLSRRLAVLMARKLHKMNELLLRCDIAYVLAAGDHESMDEGWPHHEKVFWWEEASFLERVAQGCN